MKQLQNDILDIFADIASLGQSRRVCHGKRHVKRLGKRLGKQGFPTTGRAHEQDVRLCEFNIRALTTMVEALVMVMHSNRQHSFRLGLPNDIVVKDFADFLRRGNFALFAAVQRALCFFADDVVTKLDTLIADKHSRACDQLADFMLRFSAKGAI